MGKSEFSRALTGSDSGYGDDASERFSSSASHPLARKGYEIGPASKLQIGDVFEFLWADCAEFEWEWKCLGYTRFIVLRHSDSFPHTCACVPISVGNKRDFAKPGIDSLQQGYVYASGEKQQDRQQQQQQQQQQDGLTSSSSNAGDSQASHHTHNHPPLPYSSVGISLRSGRHRVKDDSRANYGDVVEVDHEAQVMVVGDVARYFDRVRKNVNKAFMRQMLREALGPYCERKRSESAAAGVRGWGNSTATLEGGGGGGTGAEGEEGVAGAGDGDGEGEGVSPLDTSATRGEARGDHGGGGGGAGESDDTPLGTPSLDKDAEEFFSDTTRDDDDWDDASQQSPVMTYSPRPPPPHRSATAVEHRHHRSAADPPRPPADLRPSASRASSDYRPSDSSSPRPFDSPRLPDTRANSTTTSTSSSAAARSSDERRAVRAASRARAHHHHHHHSNNPEHGTAVRPGMDKAGLSSLRSLRQGLLGADRDEHDDTQSLRSLAMVGRSESFSSSRRSKK